MRHLVPLYLTAGLIGVAPVSHSEPTSTARFLFKEKVSLMDWGMYRIEETLARKDQDFLGIPGTIHVSATYDWDSNRVVIESSLLGTKVATQAEIKQACRGVVRYKRAMLGINTDTGSPIKGAWHVAAFFKPSSYAVGDIPKDIDNEIQQMIELKVNVMTPADGGAFKRGATCSGRLLSTEILFPD